MSTPVIVSFYTPEWEYASRAKALMNRCNELGLAHDIQSRESSGNWNKNTAMKAQFIQEMLAKYEHIIWMDCDGELRHIPAICIAHAHDEPILAVPHQTMACHPESPRAWHVCVISIRRTPQSIELVDRWVASLQRYDITDELAFHDVTAATTGLIHALPERYCALPHNGKFQADAVWCLGISKSPDKMAMKARQAAKRA